MKAFPTAEGFGAVSVGGRGGAVYEVTNLNDSGTGSLRACIEATGARTCVFRTGGTITVASELFVTNPFITIAGQTAPGGGICLRSAGTFGKSPIIVRTHDVIIRHLRVRPGKANTGVAVSSQACIQVGQDGFETYNVIIDHCSLTWAIDTNTQTGSQAHDLTWQWNIISEGLNNAGHSTGNHSRALNFYVGSGGTDQDMNGKISVHHNYLSDVEYRVPQVSTKHGLVETINNLVYHTTQIGMNVNATAHCSDQACIDAADSKTRWIKNYLLRTNISRNDIAIANDAPAGVGVYVQGNIGPSRLNDTLNNCNSIETSMQVNCKTTDPTFSGAFANPTNLVTQDGTALVTLDKLSETGSYAGVKSVGATLPVRDSVDARIMQNVQNYIASATDPNTVPVPGGPNQGLLDDPAQVGGYPSLAAGTALTDTDHDGIPDNWETSHGLNPNLSSDGAIVLASGYTNLENYLNEIAGDSAVSALASAASALSPGQWAILNTTNINQVFAQTGGVSTEINGYGDSMVWDPISKKVFYIGSDHYSSVTSRFATFAEYSDSDNTWRSLPTPSTPSNLFPAIYNGTTFVIQHGYDGRALDPATGNLYYRRFSTAAIFKYNVASQTWSSLPGVSPGANECCDGIAYFPEMGGLLWAENSVYNGVKLFKESTQTWVTLNSSITTCGGTPQIFAEYNPVLHLVLLGFQSKDVNTGCDKRELYKVTTSDGITAQVTQLARPPVSLYDGTSAFANMSVDPVSGIFLFLTPGGNATRQFWKYDVTGDTWTQLPNPPAPVDDWVSVGIGASARQITQTPISTYGVNMYVSCKYAQNSCATILYKHSGSVPDTSPPSTPSNLVVTPISTTQLNLSWTASFDNVGVGGYKIYRCQGSACTPSSQVATTSSTSYSDTLLTPATTYTYAVSAYDINNNISPLSTTAQGTTATPTTLTINGYPMPSIQNEKDTYTLWGWTWNANQEPANFTFPSGTFTVVDPDIHYGGEGDDEWTYLMMFKRGGQQGYVDRANAWATYMKNGYQSCSGTFERNYCTDKSFGLDHLYGYGLIAKYENSADQAALTAVSNLAADVEALWADNSPFGCLPIEGCTRYGLRLSGRHLLLITRLAERTNLQRWVTLRDRILDKLMNNNPNWNSTYGMYFLDQGNTDATAGSGAYSSGLRIASAFHVGIFMEAMAHVYRITGRQDIRDRMISIANFCKARGLDPTYQYTGNYFGVTGQGVTWHNYNFIGGTMTPKQTVDFWDGIHTSELVNGQVWAYKFTGDPSYLAMAKTFFNRGMKSVYGSPTAREADDNVVGHFVDTKFDSSTGNFYLADDKGQLLYTYMIFENGGAPTILGGTQPSPPTGFKVDVP